MSATKLVGWVVLNDSEQPLGDGRGAVMVFADYDAAARVNGHAIRPAVQPRAERAVSGRGRRKQQQEDT